MSSEDKQAVIVSAIIIGVCLLIRTGYRRLLYRERFNALQIGYPHGNCQGIGGKRSKSRSSRLDTVFSAGQ
jgi:hypothetical protein